MGVTCPECALPVTAGSVNAMGRTYHPKCFCCKMCGKELRGTHKVLDGKPYCDLCVHRHPELIKKVRRDTGKTATGKNTSSPWYSSSKRERANTNASTRSTPTYRNEPPTPPTPPASGHDYEREKERYEREKKQYEEQKRRYERERKRYEKEAKKYRNNDYPGSSSYDDDPRGPPPPGYYHHDKEGVGPYGGWDKKTGQCIIL